MICGAPESMTHSEDKEKTRHVFGLPDLAIVVIGVDGDCNDFWYRWNLASSYAENWTSRSNASIEETIWTDENL